MPTSLLASWCVIKIPCCQPHSPPMNHGLHYTIVSCLFEFSPGEVSKVTVPRQWFSGKQYKKSRKVKVFAATLADGTCWARIMPRPCDTLACCRMFDRHLAPFLRRRFPQVQRLNILLDNEKIMHTQQAKDLANKHQVFALKQYPPHSPDLNPQARLGQIVDTLT